MEDPFAPSPMRLLALSVAAAFFVAPASAQSVPGWAAPTAPSGPSAPPAEAQMMPPPTPGGGTTPTQVPLDGGLALLALAGAGYAARKLRQS